MKLRLAVAALILSAAPASAVGFSCEQARWAARTFSPETLERLGKSFNISDAERARARDCIAPPPKENKR